MHHLDVPNFLGLLVVLLAAAKLLGALAQRIGQPAVLGELVAGVIVGASVLGLVNPQNQADPRSEALHLLAEIGVVILLFEIGLETDLRQLLRVGGASAVVAVAGVALPFAFGYAACLLLGRFVVPPLFRLLAARLQLPGTPTMLAVMLAFGVAWLAHAAGSAMIIGAFAAGLLLAGTPQAHEVERGVAHLGHFFVPLFFVAVGAAVDVRVFNPFDPANWGTLQVGGLLIVAAVVGKVLAGYAPFWFRGRKVVIGVGMIPRGEVGLIFAQMGLTSGVLNAALFSAVTLTVMVTTFLAPPLLKLLFPRKEDGQKPPQPEGIEELVTEA